MTTKISIVKTDFLENLSQNNSERSFTGKKLTCLVQGPVNCLETAERFIFIIGYIQDRNFRYSQAQANYFDEQNITDQLTRFNGHFSIISVCKASDNFTIYSNKSGGNRVYFRLCNGHWLISDKLKTLITSHDVLNKSALEEEFLYRWISGDLSLINDIHQTPSGHFWQIQRNKITKKECYYRFPQSIISSTSTNSITENVEKSKELLGQALNNTLKKNEKIAVLLSGGVDSSILAGLATELGHNLVAISHRSLQHENPELQTAISFAHQLNIEHRIIDIDDRDIPTAFKNSTQIIEQAPRYHSSVILYLMFAQLEGEFSQIIYGEAADTLFGNNLLKHYIARFSKQEKARRLTNKIPLFNFIKELTPQKDKLSILLNETVNSYIAQTNQLSLTKSFLITLSNRDLFSESRNNFYRFEQNQSQKKTLAADLLIIKRFVLEADVDNHFHETGALAANFGLELVSPFVDIDVINFSAQLPLEQTLNCEYVKPILRKIGEKYFEPSLMYLPKKGFPAPHIEWLNNGLKPCVDAGINALDFPLSDKQDAESQWTVAGLGVLLTYFELPFKIEK